MTRQAPADPGHDRIGDPVTPREADRFLRGTGTFVADLVTPDTLHVAFVRSTVASGRLVGVSVAAAAGADGVVAVVTGDALGADVGPIPAAAVPDDEFARAVGLQASPQPVEPLAVRTVRHVGQAVAAVVAEDRSRAEDGAGMVVVTVEPSTPVLGPDQARRPGAPSVHAGCPGNVALRMGYARTVAPGPGTGGPPPAGPGADRDVVVESEYRIGRQTGVSIECRGVVAWPADGGRVEVWSSTQAPFVVKKAICAATGWDEDAVRVRSPDVGGGFGPKVAPSGEEVVVAYLARRLGRPVAWIEDRYESLVAAPQARDQHHQCRLQVAPDGRIVSWEDDFVVDLGVHNPWMVGVVANTALHLLGPYRIPYVRVSGTAVYTNKAPTSQYRGAGRPEASFALERALDQAARRLGIDGWEIRRRNLLGAADLPHAQGVPYRDGVEIVYDGGDYGAVLDDARALVTEDDIAALRLAAEDRRVGVGVAAYMEATARGPNEPETARLGLQPDGSLRLHTGTGPSGQSHQTVFAQVVADACCRRIGDVDVVTGDTDGVPQGLGSFASRSAVIAGSAASLASRSLLAELTGVVGEVTGAASVAPVAGGFSGQGSGMPVSWAEVAGWYGATGPLAGRPLPQAVVTFAPPTVTWTMGVHVAVVAVDPHTGAVEVLRYAVAHEAGPSLNPRVVEGQIRGGVAQGIGGALLEQVRYDEHGQPMSATLADYMVPTSADVPAIAVVHREVPSTRNPLGIRGVGESGTIGGYAVLAAAIDDALGSAAAPVSQVPVDAETVLDLLQEVRA